MNPKKKQILISIPALNEEQTVATVIENIKKFACPSLENEATVCILVVNDGSKDRTAEVAVSAGAKVISHPVPSGVGTAFHTAIEFMVRSQFDIMVTIDADGQFDPAAIPSLVAPILRGEADFVTGTRFQSNKHIAHMSRIKYWGNQRMAELISGMTGRKFSDVSCGFRAYSLQAVLQLNLLGKFTYTQETFIDLSLKGLHITEVPIEVKYFKDRKSRVARNLFSYAWKTLCIIMATYRDHRPLRFFGLFGFLIFMIGFGFDLFVFLHWIQTDSFTPYKSFGFFGGFLNLTGFLLAVVGLLADMFVRIYNVQEKILYILRRMELDK